MDDQENTKTTKCQLEDPRNTPLDFETPAVISHECEYLGTGGTCQHSGFCDFQEVDDTEPSSGHRKHEGCG